MRKGTVRKLHDAMLEAMQVVNGSPNSRLANTPSNTRGRGRYVLKTCL